jgi:putative membrane protein
MPFDQGPPTERSEGERLHPISLLFGLGAAVWGLLAVLLVWGADSCLIALVLPAVATSVVKYLSFRYWLGPDEMVIREGVLRRNERHIPYARIQNIDLIQNPLHRLFKVAVVRLETASGGKPEAVISVLTLPTIEEMRARVFRERTEGGEGEADDPAAGGRKQPLLLLSLKELAIFGAISNKGMVMFAAAFGIASQLGYVNDVEWLTQRLREQTVLPELPAAAPALSLVLLAIGGLALVLIVLRLLSIVWAVLKFYAFRLDRRGDDLRAEYGLLTKVTATIPRRRIQLVTVNLTPLHRLFGRASVQVDTAGGGDHDQPGAVKDRQWLAPVIPRRRVLELLRAVMPESRLERFDWQPISPRAWRRLLKRWLALLLLLTGAAFLAVGGFSLAIVGLGLPLAVLHARLYVRRTGYALTPATVLYRSGCWVRRVSIVPFGKIQVLGLRQTPFDRRNAMATVYVDTAGATLGGHRVAIGYLDVDTAHQVLQRLDAETSRTAFRW